MQAYDVKTKHLYINIAVPYAYIYQQMNLDTQMFWASQDVQMMRYALRLAKQGMTQQEVPVGAVLVCEGEVLGVGFNCPIGTHDATAHAEIIALREACTKAQNYRLPTNSTLYITLEPCTMCFGAIIHARVGRVVFGAYEPKAGVMASQLSLPKMPFYNHRLTVQGGLLAYECADMLSDFFKKRRCAKKQEKLKTMINQ